MNVVLASKNRTRVILVLFITVVILLLLHANPVQHLRSSLSVQQGPNDNEQTKQEIKEPVVQPLQPQPPQPQPPQPQPQPQQAEDPCANHVPWYDVAKTTRTDKINPHSYDFIYEKYLSPLLTSKKKIKFLEIGLGCDMNYGPGESLKVWKKYFECFGDNFELHFMEYDAKCANKWQAKYPDIPFHIGDQANTADLEKLLANSGGEFDVIVDDGGHSMAQQIISLEFLLTKALKPGGLYILEDLNSSFYIGEGGKYRDMFTVDYIAKTLSDMHKMSFNQSGKPRNGWLHAHILSVECAREICVFNKMPSPMPAGLVGKQLT